MNQANIVEEDVYTPYLRQFEISYSYESLVNKANTFGIDSQALTGTYVSDINQLEKTHKLVQSSENNDALNHLFIVIATWPPTLTAVAYTERINLCIENWVEAVVNGSKINTIFSAFQCLSLQLKKQNNPIQTWHLYLFELLSETIFEHQNHQINYLLAHDAITNLPNTNLLLKEIDALYAHPQPIALCLFTIRFTIERGTTTISPIIPPSLSIKIAELLNTCFTEPFSIYQSGNLLFSVLLQKQINEIQLSLLIAKIQRCFEQIINLENQAYLVSPIVGASLSNSPLSGKLFYNQARTALSHALANNKQYVQYSTEIYEFVERQKKLELDVTAAFNNEDLELYLQPIIGLPDEKCVGAEVLLRWPNAPTKGIYPNIVVEIINKVGLGKLFTRWLINTVCRLANELIYQHHLSIYLTLNLRAEDLYDSELPYLIKQSAQFWKVEAKDIILEITENGILEENEITLNTIREITQNGFKLALDDFGTGYSSMARLRSLPISLIKIDQTFVKAIDQSEEDYKIVESMAALAKSLGKDVLVEGVEGKAALALINQIGINKAQGYLFAKPMPFDEFVLWAKKNAAS